MPRIARIAPGGLIYHVLNRGVGNRALFRSRRDFEVFQRCLIETLDITPMRVLSYCVMSNHWHLVLWPQRNGDLAQFMLRLTTRHVRRWLIHRHEVGTGHVYQGRYKSFAIQADGHLNTVSRYVERNPVRTRQTKSSGDWPWSSAGQGALPAELQVQLTLPPFPHRAGWRNWVDRPQTPTEEQSLLRCVNESRPYGDEKWLILMKKKLGWREPLKRGRPKKQGT